MVAEGCKSPACNPANPIACDCPKDLMGYEHHTSMCSRNVWGMTPAEQQSYWRGMR